MWENIILIGVLCLIVAGALWYIIRARKRGQKCIGCPAAQHCTGCQACIRHTQQNSDQ